MNADPQDYLFTIKIDKNQQEEINSDSELEDHEYREKVKRLHGYKIEVRVAALPEGKAPNHNTQKARYECKIRRIFVSYAMDFVSGEVPEAQWDETMPMMNIYNPEGTIILKKLESPDN